jgi:hypothetical protein
MDSFQQLCYSTSMDRPALHHFQSFERLAKDDNVGAVSIFLVTESTAVVLVYGGIQYA